MPLSAEDKEVLAKESWFRTLLKRSTEAAANAIADGRKYLAGRHLTTAGVCQRALQHIEVLKQGD